MVKARRGCTGVYHANDFAKKGTDKSFSEVIASTK